MSQRNFMLFAIGVAVGLAFISGRFSLSRVGLVDIELRIFFLAGLLIFSGSYFINRARSINTKLFDVTSLWLAFVFFGVLLTSALWAETLDFSTPRIRDLIFLGTLMTLSAVLIASAPAVSRGILASFVIVGLLYASIAVVSSFGSSRGSIGIGGPNVATRVMFLGTVAAMVLLRAHRSVLVVVILAQVLGIIAIGSRGGLIAAIVSGVLFCAFVGAPAMKARFLDGAVKLNNLSWLSIFSAPLVLYAFYIYLFPLVNHVFEARVKKLVFERFHWAGRDEIYRASVNYITESPIYGYGLGGHSALNIKSAHPHNLFLEVLLDSGIIGLIPLLILLALCAVRLFRFNIDGRIMLIACIYMLMVQSLSGEYYDFRYFFLFLMLSYALQGQAAGVKGISHAHAWVRRSFGNKLG